MSRDIQSITTKILDSNNDLYKKDNLNKEFTDIKNKLKILEKKIDELANLIKKNDEDQFFL